MARRVAPCLLRLVYPGTYKGQEDLPPAETAELEARDAQLLVWQDLHRDMFSEDTVTRDRLLWVVQAQRALLRVPE